MKLPAFKLFVFAVIVATVYAEQFCDPFYGICEELPQDAQTEECDPEIFDCDGRNVAKERAVKVDCDPEIEGDCNCDPEIEECYTVEKKDKAPVKFYTVFEMILLVITLFGQFLAMLIPLLTGVERDALVVPQNMATFGYLSVAGLLVGYMISTGFTKQDVLEQIVINTIEHFLSNYVPLVILVTIVFSVLNATGQVGAETVYVGAFVYMLVAGLLNYVMMGLSWTSIKYVDSNWRKRAGPRLWPSVLYLTGIVDDSPEPERLEDDGTDEETVYVPYEAPEENDTPRGGIVIPDDERQNNFQNTGGNNFAIDL